MSLFLVDGDTPVEQITDTITSAVPQVGKSSLFFWIGQDFTAEALSEALKGGDGSGYYGHAGRPGERGGSAPRGVGLPDVAVDDPINRIFSDNVAEDDPLNLMFADLPRPAKKEPPPPPKPNRP